MDPGSKPSQEERFGVVPSPAEMAEPVTDVWGGVGWGKEGSAHSVSLGSGQVLFQWSWSARPCDQIWLEGSGFSHLSFFFFFFLWSIEFTSAQISKRPWLVFSTRLWILFPLDTHSMSDLGFVWITPAASRAEPWAWAPLIHSECHFEPFPNVISPKVNHKVKECALASDTMPDKYFQQATAKETQVWSCS